MRFFLVILTCVLHVTVAQADRVGESASSSPPATSSAAPREDDCKEIEPGNLRYGQSVIGRRFNDDASYLIARDSKDTKLFTAQLALNFRSAKDPENNNPELNKKWVARAQQCFKDNKDLLRAPDGRRLNVEVSSYDDDPPYPPISKILITDDPNHRSSVRNWQADIDCSVIMHEVMHLLGLCDGYHEKALKTKDNKNEFDCRHVEKSKNTIMSDHSAAASEFRLYLVCDCVSSVCNKKPMITTPTSGTPSCPRYYKETKIVTGGDLVPMTHEKSGRVILYKYEKPTALSGGQFDAISKPRCGQGLYNTCSKNAYRTSSVEGCLDVPEECKNGEWEK